MWLVKQLLPLEYLNDCTAMNDVEYRSLMSCMPLCQMSEPYLPYSHSFNRKVMFSRSIYEGSGFKVGEDKRLV